MSRASRGSFLGEKSAGVKRGAFCLRVTLKNQDSFFDVIG
jgi:hypothetical protein